LLTTITTTTTTTTTKLKMIARQKDTGFGWKLEDFKFQAGFTIVQHFHFFEKKIEKYK
jgi:hypothetical protein